MKIVKQSAELLDWAELDLYKRVEVGGRVSHLSEDRIREGSAEAFVEMLLRRRHYSPLEFARVTVGWKDGRAVWKTHVRAVRERAERGDGFWQSVAKGLARRYPAFFADVRGTTWFCRARENDDIMWWDGDGDWHPARVVTNRAISHQLVRYRNNICFMQESQRYCRYGSGKHGEGIIVIDPYPGIFHDTDAFGVWKRGVEQAERAYLDLLACGVRAEVAREVLPNAAKTELVMYAHIDEWRHIFAQRLTAEADPKIYMLLHPLWKQFVRGKLIDGELPPEPEETGAA